MVKAEARRSMGRSTWRALGLAAVLAWVPVAALAQSPVPPPAAPSAEQAPPSATQTVGTLDETASLTQEIVERSRLLLDQHILVLGVAYHEVALLADTGSDSADAAVFLPVGPTGTGLLGERVGRTTTLTLDLLSPVRRFEGSDLIGWGYNFGVSQVRFDKYESFISDTWTSEGALDGTFARFIPTLLLSRPQGEDDIVFSRSEMGLGLVAYRFTGAMHIRRNHLIPNVYYRETFVGDGRLHVGPALYISSQYLLFQRVSLGYSMLVLSYAGYYYTNMGYTAGLAFGF